MSGASLLGLPHILMDRRHYFNLIRLLKGQTPQEYIYPLAGGSKIARTMGTSRPFTGRNARHRVAGRTNRTGNQKGRRGTAVNTQGQGRRPGRRSGYGKAKQCSATITLSLERQLEFPSRTRGVGGRFVERSAAERNKTAHHASRRWAPHPLRRLGRLGLLGRLQAVAGDVQLQDHAVMHQAIDRRRCRHGVLEDRLPLRGTPVIIRPFVPLFSGSSGWDTRKDLEPCHTGRRSGDLPLKYIGSVGRWAS